MARLRDDSRFCQVDSTNCHRHGAGLGLHLHSGTLSCHAQPQHYKSRKEKWENICVTVECLGCLINKVSNTLEVSKQIKTPSYKLAGIYYTFSFILRHEVPINCSLGVLWLSPMGCHVSGILKQWKQPVGVGLDCSAPMLDTYVFPMRERSLIPSQVSGSYPSLWNRNIAF